MLLLTALSPLRPAPEAFWAAERSGWYLFRGPVFPPVADQLRIKR